MLNSRRQSQGVYIFQNSTYHYFRQVVPPDLRPAIKRTEFRVSLRTADKIIARRKAGCLSARIWDIFTALGRGDICVNLFRRYWSFHLRIEGQFNNLQSLFRRLKKRGQPSNNSWAAKTLRRQLAPLTTDLCFIHFCQFSAHRIDDLPLLSVGLFLFCPVQPVPSCL